VSNIWGFDEILSALLRKKCPKTFRLKLIFIKSVPGDHHASESRRFCRCKIGRRKGRLPSSIETVKAPEIEKSIFQVFNRVCMYIHNATSALKKHTYSQHKKYGTNIPSVLSKYRVNTLCPPSVLLKSTYVCRVCSTLHSWIGLN
jgi:hypothetical protein